MLRLLDESSLVHRLVLRIHGLLFVVVKDFVVSRAILDLFECCLEEPFILPALTSLVVDACERGDAT